MRIALLALLGCQADPAPNPSCPPAQGPLLVVGATDFTTGILATVDLETGCVDDRILSRLGGDPLVVSTGGRVALVVRQSGDAIRLYEPGQWSAPILEIGLPAGANVHDVEIVGDALFATPYDGDVLWVYDVGTGARLGEIDLSPYADSDGLPEPDALVVVGDRLFVSLQRLIRDRSSWSGDVGLVLEIDPLAHTVLDSWEVGPNPKLFAAADALVVLSGIYKEADGAVSVLHDDGLVEIRTEADEAFDFAVYGRTDAGGAVVGPEFDLWDTENPGVSQIRCWDALEADWRAGPTTTDWIADLAVDPSGIAWLAARHTGADAATASELVQLDLASCTFVGEAVPLAVAPYSLAVVE